MTITAVGTSDSMLGAGMVGCVWFDGTKQMSGKFPINALQVAKPSKIGRAVPEEED